jgi:stage V sporulation protein R
MPVNYHHWSFGKEFLKNWNKYQKGRMGLAYEIVINSNPCISYLMEENNAVTQALVIAHAAFGHNHFFKNNYLFKEWTEAGSIIDYMLFAKNFILSCEEKYGEDEVELILDAAHALSVHGVDKRKRKHKRKMSEEERMAETMKKANEEQASLDIIIKRTSVVDDEKEETQADLDLVGDEENLLYFLHKRAPNMEQWKRELLRIVYKIQQYFYPQGQTKTANEGFATFTHFYIMDDLEKRGLISADAQIAWLHQHSGVVFQPDMHSKYYDGSFNPYALGFSIYKDIRRICTDPTKEDEEWFPQLVGKDWREEVKNAAAEYRDESFIEQYLSPKLMRDLRMMSVDFDKKIGTVTEICDDRGYQNIRRGLASSYNAIDRIPDITVRSARMKGDRMLTLEYRPFRGRTLHKDMAKKTLEHVKLLWGYDVEIVQLDEDGNQKVLFKV